MGSRDVPDADCDAQWSVKYMDCGKVLNALEWWSANDSTWHLLSSISRHYSMWLKVAKPARSKIIGCIAVIGSGQDCSTGHVGRRWSLHHKSALREGHKVWSVSIGTGRYRRKCLPFLRDSLKAQGLLSHIPILVTFWLVVPREVWKLK